MTRDEAVRYFKRHIDLYCVDGICREAEEMAIEALNHHETVTEFADRCRECGKMKKGKWINNIHDIPICDQCGYMTPYDRAIDDYEYGNYCPNCGAKMEVEG